MVSWWYEPQYGNPHSAPDVEAAWSEEIRRRLAEIDSGRIDFSEQSLKMSARQ
jgi:hypothetical protein